MHACLVEAFAGSDERVAPYEEWRPWLLGDPSYDPALVLVADVDGEVAGIAQCWTEGFVKDLAVRPAYRGRGLGEALLWAVFAEFAKRGVAQVRLKVDAGNPTGAVRLYRRVGWTSCAATPSTCAAKSSFQNDSVRRRKQIRQQPTARKASWMSARRS